MDLSALPEWPAVPPEHGPVFLRAVEDDDLEMARELSTDPYVPLVGTLPLNASADEALGWIKRQQSRHAARTGFSFTIVLKGSGTAVGHCGLWLSELDKGRATAGYAVVPSRRGQGLASAALTALTDFAWTIPGLHRVALLIEPWNTASIRTAVRAGYEREGLLRSYTEIDGERRDMLLFAAVI